MEIRKILYVLPQAGIISHTKLKERISPFGYKPCKYTPGLWEHESRVTKFCLVVDNFGIKYTSDDDLQYLLSDPREKYTILVDMEGEIFCGINLKLDNIKCTVLLSMPDYVQITLERFQRRRPTSKTDAPHEWKEPVYGCKQQYADDPYTSPLLSQEKKTYVQQVIRVLLYCARAVELTIITALNLIEESQASPTKKILLIAPNYLIISVGIYKHTLN